MSSYASTPVSILDGVEIGPNILLALYEKMLRTYYVEERMKIFVRANKCSFHASSARPREAADRRDAGCSSRARTGSSPITARRR